MIKKKTKTGEGKDENNKKESKQKINEYKENI